jgi:hypothetical protein
MANRIFRKYAHALFTTKTNCPDLSADDIRVVIVDTAVDNPDTTITGDGFLADIAAGARLAVTGALAGKTVVDAVFDATDVSVPDAGGGATGEVAVVYFHTGVEATARLLFLIDTATGLPLTLDGVADLLRWHASGIAAL